MTLDEFEKQLSEIMDAHAKDRVNIAKRLDAGVAALVSLANSAGSDAGVVNAIVKAKERELSLKLASIQGQGITH